MVNKYRLVVDTVQGGDSSGETVCIVYAVDAMRAFHSTMIPVFHILYRVFKRHKSVKLLAHLFRWQFLYATEAMACSSKLQDDTKTTLIVNSIPVK